MTEFNYQDTGDELIIDLPDELKYGFSFLNNITEMLGNVAQGKYKRILIDCPQGAVYDKMSKAYLFNVLLYLTESNEIFWSKALSRMIAPNIQKKPGSQFEPVEMIQRCIDEKLEYYEFENNDSVSAPVNEMARLLVEENLIINAEKVKEFLSTTIGEVFSNCFLHSNQNKAFFMYDVLQEESEFYLCVNIVDYGTTLVNNVKEYFMNSQNKVLQSTECFNWAIKSGTTTRVGSGGYGLATLIEYIEKAKGELYIFSGDAYYSLKEQKVEIKECKGNFYGTSVTFKVRLFESSQFMMYDSSKHKIVTISLDSI